MPVVVRTTKGPGSLVSQVGLAMYVALRGWAAWSATVPLIGTLGVILRARRAGLVPAARPLVEGLLDSGSYLAADLVRQALAKVGE